MLRPIATVVVLLLAGCGGTNASSGRSTSPVTVEDRAACALLFARLQRVTLALRTSSELVAHSRNARQLSDHIATEQIQLERSARLMTGGPIPAPLRAADRQLVAALRAFSRDFARAKGQAAHGDFRGASESMRDPPVVRRILRASRTIEAACR
jgi:hypothetical protein